MLQPNHRRSRTAVFLRSCHCFVDSSETGTRRAWGKTRAAEVIEPILEINALDIIQIIIGWRSHQPRATNHYSKWYSSNGYVSFPYCTRHTHLYVCPRCKVKWSSPASAPEGR